MKNKSLLILAITAMNIISMSCAFVSYSCFRAMNEIVGLHIGKVMSNSVLVFFLFVPIIMLISIASMRFYRPTISWYILALMMTLSCLCGILIGEFSMLSDEFKFRHEVTRIQMSGMDSYSRSRAWPNGNSTLTWQRISGIHATD